MTSFQMAFLTAPTAYFSVTASAAPNAGRCSTTRRNFVRVSSTALISVALTAHGARSARAGELEVTDVTVGDGDELETGKRAKVQYTLTLGGFDGKLIDTSRGRRPFTFKAGLGEVIKGWDQGVLGMRVHGRRKLIIPPELGYGERGAGGVIPPNATLYFDVELLAVN